MSDIVDSGATSHNLSIFPSRKWRQSQLEKLRLEKEEFDRDVLATIPALRAFAISLTRNHADADDLTQNTVLKVLTFRHQFIIGSSLRKWSFKIMRNTWISSLRRPANVSPSDLEIDEAEHAATPAPQPWIMASIELRRALEKIPVDQRDAVILVGALGCAYEEAAEILACPVGTVKSRLFRGRQRLAEMLGSPVEIAAAI